jgi:hypothetical protein
MAPGPELGVLLAGIDISVLAGSDAVELTQTYAASLTGPSPLAAYTLTAAGVRPSPGERGPPPEPRLRAGGGPAFHPPMGEGVGGGNPYGPFVSTGRYYRSGPAGPEILELPRRSVTRKQFVS